MGDTAVRVLPAHATVGAARRCQTWPVGAEELEVQGLAKSFGDLVVLRGVDLRVEPGRLLGFLGRNGAGKTTTMRCVFGLLEHDAGMVTYGGRGLTRAQRRSFGYMPEERGLYPKMPVLAQLVHLGRLSGMRRPAARESAYRWLERLGLAARAGARLETLSHGNQQRVQLAAALVHDPEVLVLDEPFSGLDPVGVQEMGDVLREAATRGATILFSSHQLELVEDLCVDIAIIDGGRTVAAGELASIRAAAGYRRVEVSVAGRPWVPEGIGRIRVEGDRRVALVPDRVPAEQVLAAAAAAGPVTSFRYEAPTLADLFHAAIADPTGGPAPHGSRSAAGPPGDLPPYQRPGSRGRGGADRD